MPKGWFVNHVSNKMFNISSGDGVWGQLFAMLENFGKQSS